MYFDGLSYRRSAENVEDYFGRKTTPYLVLWMTVDEAYLISPNTLELIVGSCNSSPKVSRLVESDADVQIKAVVTPPRLIALSGNDCQDVVEVQLAGPLGDRVIIDRHTGQNVRVRDRSRTSQ